MSPATEAERSNMLLIAWLRAEIELLERQLSEAAAWIASLSSEKVGLETRIALALEYDMAEMVRAKDNAHNVAQLTIVALKASIGSLDVSPSSVMAGCLTASNNAWKDSLKGVGDPPISATTFCHSTAMGLGPMRCPCLCVGKI